MIGQVFDEHASVVAETRSVISLAEKVAEILISSLRAGGIVLFCGNGGSATDADHLATELVGRFEANRPALRAMSLATSSGTLTAVSNDFGFDEVFARQVEAHADSKAVLVAISTSGNSPSVLQAAKSARKLGAKVVGMTGRSGGELADLCDVCLKIPSDRTARVQEMHLLLGHAICGIVEQEMFMDAAS